MPLYPALPGPRIPYDRNGAVGHYHYWPYGTSSYDTLGAGDLQTINRESGSGLTYLGARCSFGVPVYLNLVFPRMIDLVGIYAMCDTDNLSWAYSTSTTDGEDGTYGGGGSLPAGGGGATGWRSGISSFAPVTGIKAVQVSLSTTGYSNNVNLLRLHLFGTLTVGDPVIDALRIWHPSLDQPIGGDDLDYNDIPRSTNLTKTFRVKNISPAHTAFGNVLSMEVLTDATPSIIGQYQFSDGGGVWGNTLAVPNLTAGQISPVYYLRDSPFSTAATGPFAGRIVALASSFS